MSCGSGLTSLVMIAGGSMVTNGALSGTFGAAPFSSLASSPLSLSDLATGLTDFAPTLSTMVSGLAAISGAGAPLAAMGPMLSAIQGAGFSTNMLSAFNAIPTDLGVGGGFFDAIGGFAPSVNGLLTDVTGGSGVLNDALKYAGDWSADVLGGSFGGIGGDVIGNPAKFGTILSAASGYVDTANQFINSATNSNAFGSTFNSLDNLITGGLADVNIDVAGFGGDLLKIGKAINFDSLENLGSPGQLLQNLELEGNLGPMFEKVANIQIDESTARSLGAGVTNFLKQELVATANEKLPLNAFNLDITTLAKQGGALPTNFQQEIYKELALLDENAVDQVKGILGVTQTGIDKATDLLDPQKLFKDSFETFVTPLRTASVGFRGVYDTDGSVNPQLNEFGSKLKGIIPDDLAVANDAISRSLRQVKNIHQTSSASLGDSLSGLETLKDLDKLQNLDKALPDNVKTYWLEEYGINNTYNVELATGNAGQLKLSDVIGFAAGYNSAAPITKNSQLIKEMDDAGELTDITGSFGIYETVQKFCNGDFGPVETPPSSGNFVTTITSGYVGAGTYSASSNDESFEDAWVDGIVPGIKTILSGFSTNSRVIDIMANSERWNTQLAREYLNHERIDNETLASTPENQTVAIQLAQNLPNLGLDTAEGGSAEILERIVDFSSLGGQAVIATMREGRNLAKLSNANVEQDTSLDITGVQDPADLTTGQYTKTEAEDRVVR